MKRTAIISAVLAIMACFPSYAENVSFGTEDAAQSDTLKVKKKKSRKPNRFPGQKVILVDFW